MPTYQGTQLVTLTERHEISVPIPRTITDAELRRIWDAAVEIAGEYLEAQGVQVDVWEFDTLSERGADDHSDTDGELCAGVWFDIPVAKGTTDQLVFSARWATWHAKLTAMAARQRTSDRHNALIAGDAAGAAAIIDLEGYRS